VVESTPKI